VNLPNDFIYVYTAILYPDNEEDVLQYALRISYDSFYTYSNLLYKNYVVAIACVILAAKFLALPTVIDKKFKYLENMKAFSNPPAEEEEFNKRLLNFENKSFHLVDIEMETDGTNTNLKNEYSYFDILEWNKKVHPNLELDDLSSCINMIIEYYEDCKKIDKVEKSEKK
jgi:hypothetical protein